MTTIKTPQLTFLRLLVGAASLTIIIATMNLAAAYISPILLAFFLAILVSPIWRWLQKKGLPNGLALLVMIVGVVVIGLGLSWFLSVSFGQLADSLSTYQAQFQTWLTETQTTLASQGVDASDQALGAQDVEQIVQFLTNFLARIGSLVVMAIFVIVTAIFALLEGPTFHATLKQSLGDNNPLVRRTTEFDQSVVRYFGLRSLVNLITGSLVTVLLWILGIDYALLWGVLTFFLSYVPYLGIFLATVPSVLLAWVQYGPGMALTVIVGVTIINVAAENLVAPKLVGRGLSISPLIVFLSFMFWSWVLGPLGMLLSMPLTIIIMMLLDSFDDTRWVADLMAGGVKSSTAADQDAS